MTLKIRHYCTMSRTVICMIALLFSTATLAQSATTKEGYVACLSPEAYDDYLSFANAKDTASIEAYIEAKKCIGLKGGLPATITDSVGAFGATKEFVIQGIKFWGPMEMLDRGK